MKKLICSLIFLLPVVVCAQQYGCKSAPVDYAWKYVGIPGFSLGYASYPCIAFSPSGQAFVAYTDSWSNDKATVMKFDGTNWANVGSPWFSGEMAQFLSFAFSPAGQPYLAYSDSWSDYKATVMTFDGTNWVNVGNAGFSPIYALYTSLAFNPAGEPCVAFLDYGQNRKASVMKFDGNNWVYVGNAGFSPGMATFIRLAFSPSGEPYLAFADSVMSNKATVMRFDETHWVNVGNSGFSVADAGWISLVFDPSGQPYVAFGGSYGDAQKATVMKFDGTNWVDVGDPGFSAGYVIFTRLAFSPSGQPFVAYADEATYLANKATVMKFDGTKWTPVGNSGFSEGAIGMIDLAFGSSDQPYVVFQDDANGWKATVMRYDSVFVGISELKPSQMSIYPDPASDKITIITQDIGYGSNLEIVNIEGKKYTTQKVKENKTELDIAGLPKGFYFVRLTNDRTVQVGRIIKQ